LHLEVFGAEAGFEKFDVGEQVVNDKNAGGHENGLRKNKKE
jgi:hypothetical protein